MPDRFGFLLPAFVFLSMLTTACADRAGTAWTAEEQAARDSVLALFDAADRAPFEDSFARLSRYEYQRYIRTEQYDDEDFMLAYDEYLVRVEGEAEHRISHIERSDSAGAFDFGFFNRFVSENVETADPIDLVPNVLPDDVGYTSPRNAEKYTYRVLADTLLWDRQAMVLEINAKPELGDGLNIRVVRYYIDRSTNVLLAVYLERIDLGMLFREESVFYLDMHTGPDGTFLPYNSRFRTRIKTPFRGAYTIRTVSTFSAFRRAG